MAAFGWLVLITIEAGASTNRWSWQPVGNVTPPVPREAELARNPIDDFILARLEQDGLKPAPRADRYTFLRRVCLDLTGLPPTPDQIERFCRSGSSESCEELADRLLASPQYGERWARHWLDLVRYADTGGFEKDLSYHDAWRYRDYVIRSLNANKPADRFIEEQVAGDELWPGDPDALAATGLYAVGPVSQDSALNSTQLEYEWLTDSADTTGAAFLGLTLGCARCHDHKYDPITQRDYYAMQAIFAASDRPYPNDVRELRIKGLNGILADVPIPKNLLNDPRCTLRTDEHNGAELFHRTAPLEIHRLQRGELSKPAEKVGPGLPVIFNADKSGFDFEKIPPNRRRTVLAHWLVSPANPLTARVFVNRIWTWHFGQGLVRTPNDFGAQGEAPTHPKLLDWLARDFVEHGWDLKRLHKLIVTSATYQTRGTGEFARASEIDPENRLLSHFPRTRLDAEEIWDGLHACAGTINLEQFGPPVVPPLTKSELSGLFGDEKWKVTRERADYSRRGIYLFERRTFLFPLFDAFDPPDVMASCPRRFETIVPTQALAMLNSPAVLEQARAFSKRLLKEGAARPESIPARAWLLAFNRPITTEEQTRVETFLGIGRSANQGSSGVREKRAAPDEDRLTELCLALFNANEFMFVE